MQSKYLEQIRELYEDFNVTVMPQLEDEVRGVPALEQFSALLLNPPAYQPPAPAAAAAAAAASAAAAPKKA
jgi:arsenite-transporting ATPase